MNNGQVLGLLGGGQLGRMLSEPASRLNIPLRILDTPDDNCSPAKMITPGPHHKGSFADADAVHKLAKEVDVITVEIEHVNANILKQVVLQEAKDVKTNGKQLRVYPGPDLIATIQDKFVQKEYLSSRKFPIPEYMVLEPSSDSNNVDNWREPVETAAAKLGWPLVLKARKQAYDGRGNAVVRDVSSACKEAARLQKASNDGGIYVEKMVPFVRELACMVARSQDGRHVVSYPIVETIHRNSVCHVVLCPANVDDKIRQKAQEIARNAVNALGGCDLMEGGVGYDGAVGVFGVEMFQSEDGTILINEIAPRPHNSGHYTIESCLTSQYENHLRAVLGLPLGSPSLKVGASVMVNILGAPSNSMTDTIKPAAVALGIPGASVHLYGKEECRAGRKMGHITVTGDTSNECMERAKPILDSVDALTNWTEVTSTTSNPTAQFGSSPLVGIIMGSDSDLPTMKAAAEILRSFKVPFELTIVSAHRTPQRMMEYARCAHDRGLKVIIAAAGGAAHLPGMVAALTPLPVIGVPVKLKTLDGVDSLHSIVQMPRGVPVATVAIDNSTNAALLAIRILGSHLPEYRTKMIEYQEQMEQEVLQKVEKLKEKGWENY